MIDLIAVLDNDIKTSTRQLTMRCRDTWQVPKPLDLRLRVGVTQGAWMQGRLPGRRKPYKMVKRG